MNLQPFDACTATDDDWRDRHLLAGCAQRWQTPGLPADPEAWTRARISHAPDFAEMRHWITRDDEGRPVAAVSTWAESPENAHVVSVQVDADDTHPAYEPAVRSVLSAVAEYAKEVGRSTLILEAVEAEPLAALGARLGFTVGLQDVGSQLALDQLDDDALRAIVDQDDPRRAGQRLLTWDGAAPAELMDSYVAAVHAMNDAPRGDLDLQDELITPERLRGWLGWYGARGQRVVTTATLDEGTGKVSAFTELAYSSVRPWYVDQENTGVPREFRGRGLGLYVKAANLLALRERAPEATWVMTWNAASNEHMLAVNRALGFRPHVMWVEMQATLDQLRLDA